MKNRRFYFTWALILIFGILSIIAFGLIYSSNSKENYEQVALQVNHQFVEKFFTYSLTNQRYEGIKPLMTEQGYRALFPSGIEMPKDSAVKSFVTNLKIYVQKAPSLKEGEMELLNDFLVSTEFGGIQSSKGVIMRTKLVKEQSTWKINDIEMVIQNTKE